MRYYDDDYDFDDEDIYGLNRADRFADPGGKSALRAASRSNPRDLPCPSCRHPNRLTSEDVARGYQCDRCADACEGMGEIDYFEGEDE